MSVNITARKPESIAAERFGTGGSQGCSVLGISRS
jgi:hypothetical protein